MLRRGPRRPSDRELAALADGSLAGPRRADVEGLVARSPELQAVVHEQRAAVGAIRDAAVPAPSGLRARVTREQAPTTRRRGRRGRRSATLVAVPAVLAAAIVVVVLTTVGSGTPTVAQAASLAARGPIAAAPPGNRGEVLAGARGAGLAFPYWEDRFGWRATGVRRDSLSGRGATTVFYRDGGWSIGYTIVAGAALHAPSGARWTVRDGVRVAAFRLDGRAGVTWLRRGHTCVLSGVGVSEELLVRLAAWRGHGTIAY